MGRKRILQLQRNVIDALRSVQSVVEQAQLSQKMKRAIHMLLCAGYVELSEGILNFITSLAFLQSILMYER